MTKEQLTLGGVQPRVTVEDGPEEKAVKQTMGKLIDAAKAVLAEKTLIGWKAIPEWKAKALCMESEGQGGRHIVARIGDSGLPVFDEAELQTVFGCTVAIFEQKYVAARRR